MNNYKKKTNRDIKIFYQEHATGLGDAILCCKDFIEGNSFYLSLPDNVLFYGDKPNPFKVLHKVFKISNISIIGLIDINSNRDYFKKYHIILFDFKYNIINVLSDYFIIEEEIL